MGAEGLPEAFVAAFPDQVQVEVRDRRQEVIGVGDQIPLGFRVGDREAVIRGEFVFEADGPDVVAEVLHGAGLVVDEDLDVDRAQLPGADHGAAGRKRMPAIEVVWGVVLADQQALEVSFRDEELIRAVCGGGSHR